MNDELPGAVGAGGILEARHDALSPALKMSIGAPFYFGQMHEDRHAVIRDLIRNVNFPVKVDHHPRLTRMLAKAYVGRFNRATGQRQPRFERSSPVRLRSQ